MKKGYLKYLFFIPALFVLAGCSKPYSEALPSVQVTSVEAYGVADSVLITGTVTSQGGGPIQYEGFSFSNTPTFDLLSRQVVGSSGSTTFSTVLPAYHDSTFYFEAFAANEYGYAVSKPYTYTVPAAKPDSAPCTLRSNSFTIGSNTYSLSGISTNPSPSFGSYEVSASFSGGFYNYDVYFNQLPTNGIYSVLTQSDLIDEPYNRYAVAIVFESSYSFSESGYLYVAQNKDGSTTLSFCSLNLYYFMQNYSCSSKVTFN